MSKESFDKKLVTSDDEEFLTSSKFRSVSRIITFWVALFVITQLMGSIVFVSLAQTIKSAFGDASVISFENSVPLRFGLLATIYITTGIVTWFVLRKQKFNYKDFGLNIVRIPSSLVYALLIYIMYFVVFVALNYFIATFINVIDTDQAQQLGFPEPRGYEFGLIFLILTVFPSLVEEFIFRGMIFGRIKKIINWKLATILTSIVFGLLHLEFFSGNSLNWIAAVDTGVFSLFLCYAYQKTNSLWTPIIIHFIKNSLAFVVLFVIKYNS